MQGAYSFSLNLGQVDAKMAYVILFLLCGNILYLEVICGHGGQWVLMDLTLRKVFPSFKWGA